MPMSFHEGAWLARVVAADIEEACRGGKAPFYWLSGKRTYEEKPYEEKPYYWTIAAKKTQPRTWSGQKMPEQTLKHHTFERKLFVNSNGTSKPAWFEIEQ